MRSAGRWRHVFPGRPLVTLGPGARAPERGPAERAYRIERRGAEVRVLVPYLSAWDADRPENSTGVP